MPRKDFHGLGEVEKFVVLAAHVAVAVAVAVVTVAPLRTPVPSSRKYEIIVIGD